MKKHLFMCIALMTILGYFYFNFIGTLSQNVIPVSKEEKSVISFFFPQGWGFFTKDPREPKYKLYRLSENNSPELVNFKISSPQNALGFSRKGSRISIEMIRIQNRLPKDPEWTKSNLDINEFEMDLHHLDTITMSQQNLLYIKPGKYIFQAYNLTPWNWLKYPKNYSKEYKYYQIELISKDDIIL